MNETQNEEQLRFPDDIMEEGGNLAGRIEAILFVAGEAVRVEDLSKALDVPIREVEDALIHLRDEYDFNQRGFSLKRYGHQVQLATRALYSQDVVRLLQPVQKQSLSQAAMETLAVVAYRQPVTRAEVEQIRGVKCDYSLQSLMNKELIAEVGRKEALGRPDSLRYDGQFSGAFRHFVAQRAAADAGKAQGRFGRRGNDRRRAGIDSISRRK